MDSAVANPLRFRPATEPAALAEPDAAGTASATLDGAEEEALVADARAGLTPAQMVERKLGSLLKSNPLPVSHMMTGSRSIRAR
jgi:hypothetical protein